MATTSRYPARHQQQQQQHKKHEESDDDVVIVLALRTPLGRSRKGGLALVPPATLLQTVLQGVLEHPLLQTTTTTTTTPSSSSSSSQNQHKADTSTRKKITTPHAYIQELVVGNVLMPPSGFAAWRMAAVAAGLPADQVSLMTVNRQCASGLQAVASIAQAIQTGSIHTGIGAGVESMSMYPMDKMEPPVVDWNVMQQHDQAMDCLLPMGLTSEAVTQEYGLTRHELDQFAVNSHTKAAAAQAAGKFRQEIVPVGTMTQDDGIRPNTTLAILSQLPPAFLPETGHTTAGNSSQTTDGAAAVLLTTRGQARQRQWPIQAIWRGYAVAAVPPRLMGIGPAYAIPMVLQQCGLTVDDIDVFEINEAFSSQALWCIRHLQLDPAKVNPSGGAIALGHPLGCTGARMVATLVAELQRRPAAKYGVMSMCIGTGMGAAAVIEIPSTTTSRL